ncbi:hypothetical protein NG798_00525 [Ancylothrix sp. C2]|uniref:hypothetical protein n=1 Tax=Ancylothrix sp. D3o TaxID=2953691 RepID=UPI0021BB982B|nr:hypothetical protein [Ancylothrix sp. D3o]MCT7948277.1 hypothetical protein [Ancylothrix sp. D3o]
MKRLNKATTTRVSSKAKQSKKISLTPLEERVLKLFIDLETDWVAITQIEPGDEKLLIKSLRSLERKNFITYYASDYEVELLKDGAQWLKDWGLIKDFEIFSPRKSPPYIPPYVCVVTWDD